MHIFFHVTLIYLIICKCQRKGTQAVCTPPSSSSPHPKEVLHVGSNYEAWRSKKKNKKKTSEHFHYLFAPCPSCTSWGSVGDTDTPHLKHSSVHDSVSSNKRHGETTRLLFSHHSKVASYPWSSESRCERNWRLESEAHINICMYHMDEQEREMIGSETGPGFGVANRTPLSTPQHTHRS